MQIHRRILGISMLTVWPLLLFPSLACAFAPRKSGYDSLGLRDYQTLVLQGNLSLESARAAVDADQNAAKMERSRLLPQFDLNGDAYRFRGLNEVPTVDPEGEVYRGSISFHQLLFDFGRKSARYRAARKQELAADFSAGETLRSLFYQAFTAYFHCQLAVALRRVAVESCSLSQWQLQQARVSVESGRESFTSLLKAQADSSVSSINLMSADYQVRTWFRQLEKIAGKPMPDPLRLTEPLEILESLPDTAAKAAVDLDNHPSVLLRKMQSESQQALRTSAQKALLPEISALGDYSLRKYKQEDWKPVWKVGVQLSAPLMDGGERFFGLKKAEAESRQAKATLTQVRWEIQHEFQDAYDGAKDAYAKVSAIKNLVAKAQLDLDVSRERYQVGKAGTVDILEAKMALTQAESELSQSYFDARVAYYRLVQASGRD